MILGVFGPDGSAYVIAHIKVPRLMVEGAFPFLVDTGADETTLHMRDAIQLLSTEVIANPIGNNPKSWAKIKKRFRLLGNLALIGGVGGTAAYFKEPAQITFTHHDNTEEDCVFDLNIAKPERFKSRKFRQQFELPSLLGIDILNRFRLVMDYSNNQISLFTLNSVEP